MAENDAQRFAETLSQLKTVGRYQILQKLGQTAATFVFQAKDPYIGRNVALRISPLLSPGARDGFFALVRSSGKLSHTNIACIYDAGVRPEYCYIAGEYVDGPKLEAFCSPETRLPVATVANIALQVCQALEYAHNHGVIHKDVRPANIMLAGGVEPKISDFGVAPHVEQRALAEAVSNPAYISPEVLKGVSPGVQNDIFGLGCVLYEALCGHKPFTGDNAAAIKYRVLHDEPAPVTSLAPDVPAVFDKILQKALAKDPHARFETCADFSYTLRVALRGLSGAGSLKREKVEDAVDYVHSVPFFRDFSKKQIRELLAASELMQLEVGRSIVREGEIDDSFYILLNGKAEVSIQGNKIAELGFGECFGEMSYISGEPRAATVTAASQAALMRIRGDLLDRAPASIQLLFYRKFALALARRLTESSQKSKAL